MSYEATANLFYGIWTSEEELRTAMGLPKKGHWEEVEDACKDAGLNIIMAGNGLSGALEMGLSIINFEVDEGLMAIPGDKMIVPDASLRRLQKFLDTYRIKEPIGWHLGASYG